ncbi:MAG: DUF2442 domain-containing protein [Chloroflexi bacterium]|nr:DUF2442 domain-containing protein [Chloroflexota bacterium]
MNSSYYELIELKLSDARAMDVQVTEDALTIDLDDARTISVPLVWYPRLWHGAPDERNNWEITGAGYGIHWPDLDEDISVKGLLIGFTSGESPESFKRWLERREMQENKNDETLALSLEGKTFWETVYELRKKDLIPLVWKREHIRPYMERPNGQFAPNAVTTIPSNQSMSKDGSEKGDYVKKGRAAKAWRIGKGEFKLIDDPNI